MTSATPLPVRRKKKWIIGTGLIFLAAAITNVVFFLSSDKRDFYYPATYKTLYVPTDVPVLVGTRIVSRGQVELKIRGPEAPARWKITDDTGESYSNDGPLPIVRLKDYKHTYELEAGGGAAAWKKITVQFGYYPSEYYKKGGRTQPDNYWIVSASIPMGKFPRRPLSFWSDPYDDIDPADREEAKRILKEEIGLLDSDAAAAKIEKIACWLITKWKDGGGTPSDAIEKERSPLRILKMVLNGEGKIWCSQHALIYHFFANMAGLPTRLISLAGRIDTVITTGHAFTETFISELGVWAKVDPSLNKLLMLNAEGRPLGSAEVYNAIVSENISVLTARACREGETVSIPYAEVSGDDGLYYSPGAHLVYRRPGSRGRGWFVHYLFKPDFAYSLDASAQRRAYDWRSGLFIAWCAAVLFLGFAILRRAR
jgi:hypothetical protein